MSSVSAAIQPTLAAQQHATASKINIAVLGKQLDSQRQIGDAINQMLESTVEAQKQIAKGHLDVRA